MDESLRNQVAAYITQQRAAGIADTQIAGEMIEHGWDENTVRAILAANQASVNQVQFTPQLVQSPVVDNQNQVPHSNKRWKLLFIGITAALLIVAAAFLVIKPEPKSNQAATNTEEFATFTDPNFSVNLPKAWNGDAGYQPGGTTFFYYSDEDSNEENRTKAAYMTMFIIEGKVDRTAQQLDSLEQLNAKFEVIRDEETKFGNYTGRVVELIVASAQQPDKNTHRVSFQVSNEKYTYSVDIASLDEYWQLHQAEIEEIMHSFRPLP